VAAPDLSQPDPSAVKYSCAKCGQNTIPLIKFDMSAVKMDDPYNELK